MYASQSWVKELVTRLFKKNNEYMLSKTCNYSLEEQVIGTWIDGRPLYERTINLGSIEIIPNKTTNLEISNENISEIIDSRFIVSSSNISDNGVTYIDLWKNGSIFAYMASAGWGAYSYRTVYLTIQYTKTTD